MPEIKSVMVVYVIIYVKQTAINADILLLMIYKGVKMNCKNCPHYRENKIIDCAANAHGVDDRCDFEVQWNNIVEFAKWKISRDNGKPL